MFEQNARPYGKIEDGLPRWHVKLRQKEYEEVNERLDHPAVHFVPLTKIGRDIDFQALAREWGFTAVILALGAWRDRPLPLEGADQFVSRGLVYQNPLIHWFNHFTEADYNGPQYEPVDRAIVVGGGLASIDVMKVLQIETVRRALERRGIQEDMLHLEHAGIADALAAHHLTWEALGLQGATLFYRRRMEDMPLTEIPADADAARRQKYEMTRRRIIEKAMQKYLFNVQPLRLPVGLLIERERLGGLRFQHTTVEAAQVVPVAGALEEVRAPLVISSIGSIPEPLPGHRRARRAVRFQRPRARAASPGTRPSSVPATPITGKGNIAASRRHSIEVATHLIEQFLGLGEGRHEGEEQLLEYDHLSGDDSADKIATGWARARRSILPKSTRSCAASAPASRRSATPARTATGSSVTRRRPERCLRTPR